MASGCFQECSSRYIFSFLFSLQPKVFGVLLLLVTPVKGSNFLRNENLRRQRKNGKRKRRM